MKKASLFILLLTGLLICLSVIFKIKQKDNNSVVPAKVAVHSLNHVETFR